MLFIIIFIIICLCAASSQNDTVSVKMSYSRKWFENVQTHFCTFTGAHKELMCLCITLNGYNTLPWFRMSHFHFCH